jgi:hypothetical protein
MAQLARVPERVRPAPIPIAAQGLVDRRLIELCGAAQRDQ